MTTGCSSPFNPSPLRYFIHQTLCDVFAEPPPPDSHLLAFSTAQTKSRMHSISIGIELEVVIVDLPPNALEHIVNNKAQRGQFNSADAASVPEGPGNPRTKSQYRIPQYYSLPSTEHRAGYFLCH